MIQITHITLIGVKPSRRPFHAEIPVTEIDKLRYELMKDYDAAYCYFEFNNVEN